jgi:hypothetical protein
VGRRKLPADFDRRTVCEALKSADAYDALRRFIEDGLHEPLAAGLTLELPPDERFNLGVGANAAREFDRLRVLIDRTDLCRVLCDPRADQEAIRLDATHLK